MKHIKTLTSMLALVSAFALPGAASAHNNEPCSQGSAKKRQACVVDEIITNVNLSNVAQQYTQFYAPNAQFNDPTITVQGRDNIIAHLQQSLQSVSIDAIRVDDVVSTDGVWVTTYEMDTHLMIPINGVPTPIGEQITLKAATVLKFGCDNKIVYHRDYFDQFAIYQQIPNFDATIQGILFQYIGSLFGAP